MAVDEASGSTSSTSYQAPGIYIARNKLGDFHNQKIRYFIGRGKEGRIGPSNEAERQRVHTEKA